MSAVCMEQIKKQTVCGEAQFLLLQEHDPVKLKMDSSYLVSTFLIQTEKSALSQEQFVEALLFFPLWRTI